MDYLELTLTVEADFSEILMAELAEIGFDSFVETEDGLQAYVLENEFEERALKELMENYPDGIASIQMRERIVLPLLTIQQYALLKINELNKEENPDLNLIKVYEKIVTRSLFGNTNASRNSA